MIEYLIEVTICQNRSTLNRFIEAVSFFSVSWEGHGRLQCRHNGRAMPWEDPVLASEPDGIGDEGCDLRLRGSGGDLRLRGAEAEMPRGVMRLENNS